MAPQFHQPNSGSQPGELSGLISPSDFLKDVTQRFEGDAGRVTLDDHGSLHYIAAVALMQQNSLLALEAAELCERIGQKLLPARDLRSLKDRSLLAAAQLANGKTALAIDTLLKTIEYIESTSIGTIETRLDLHSTLSKYFLLDDDSESALHWALRGEQIAQKSAECPLACQMALKLNSSQAYKRQGDQTQSGRKFIEAYDLLRNLGDGISPSIKFRSQAEDVIDVMQEMIASCQANQQFYEAELLAKETLRIANIVPGDTARLKQELSELLARTLWENGKFDQAKTVYEKLEESGAGASDEMSLLSRSLRKFALIGETEGPFEEERALTRYLSELKSSATASPFAFVNAYLALARTRLEQGRGVAARESVRECWDLIRDLAPPAVYDALMSNQHEMQHEVQDALSIAPAHMLPMLKGIVQAAAELYHIGGMSLYQAQAIRNMGQEETEDFEQTLTVVRDTLEKSRLLQSLAGMSQDRSSSSRATFSLSQILAVSGEEQLGREMVEEALDLVTPEPHTLPGLNYMQIAVGNARLQRMDGAYAKADELLEEASTILDRFPRYRESGLKASLLAEKAQLAMALGQKEHAIEMLQEAEGILASHGEDSSPSMLTMQMLLQEAYQEAGDYEAAEKAGSRVEGISGALKFENESDDQEFIP